MRNAGPVRVILDTNALLMQFQFGIDIERELAGIFGAFEMLIPSSVLEELRGLRNRYARAALKIADKYEVVNTELKGDRSLIKLAKELGAVVVTNDRELRKELKQNGIKVVYLRQRSHLTLDIP